MKPLVLVGASLCAFYRNGGMAWERLSWIVGMRRLGFDVLAVDQLDERQCVNPPGMPRGYDRCLNIDWGMAIAERFGLADDIAVLGAAGQSLAGRSYSDVVELAGEAEMLVNVAGDLRLDAIKQRVRRRVLVDMDPGITQLWLASGRPVPRVSGHNFHFTIGSNVGTARSSLPTSGLRWHHTRQPVLLDAWPPADDPDPGRLTSILRWRGVGPHGTLAKLGYDFPDKADALLDLLPLPSRIPESIELVLRIVPAEDGVWQRLESNGWRVVSPEVVAEPESFASYVQASGGEISVAKGAYVATRSGWFSDRTTRYLASGLPAIVQDTGFAADVPVGEGLLAFSTLAEAVDAAHRVAADYEAHRRAARQIAETYFASDVVLGRLAETVMDTT